ncbi:translation initiation factor eIF-2B subunit delta isoform X2 [Agrilus planipennis]|uniref:Translation initiation factor eIF2B subunit delta n=1 Tax=Agrilus planipennis TaxID=224129 RepID=A0A1W4WIM5_AGRPL|nr:translation initiation factor eIF-2B subunit delta isoform X2 [Agrilus planipennis]
MNQDKEKDQKVGGDGLTKKQRRALKVSAKTAGTSPNEILNNIHITNTKDIKKDVVFKSNENVKCPTQNKPQVVTVEKHFKSEPSEDKPSIDRTKNVDIKGELSKAEVRAQRRAIQEAQRLAKQQKTQEKIDKADEKKPQIVSKDKEKPKVEKKPKLKVAQKIIKPKETKVQLFSHLSVATKEKGSVVVEEVHPAFVRLGAQYASKTILGSNARCLALLSALKSLIESFESPPEQEFCRSLEVALQNCVNYLQIYRPIAVSMTNVLRYFKLVLAELKTNLQDIEKKNSLIKWIDDYMHDEIGKAGEAISMKVEGKISNGDTILTYGCSSLVLRILLEAHNKNKKQFRVIVVDANPLFEGKEMLRRLVNAGIECTYVLINAISFVMNKATKVLLGVHALLANGYVMSRIGTAQIALIAKTYSKPVLVCCETYKFCERVQTDSIVFNEIGDPNELIRPSEKKQADNVNAKLTHLNLMYDVTPPDLVTAVATELAILPCTSVPVILRIDLEKSKK